MGTTTFVMRNGRGHAYATRRSRRGPSVYRAPPPPAYVLRRASEAAPLAPTIHLMGTVASYPRNSEIFGESDPADYLYNVINGGVRTYKIFSDGRRQIGGFYLPGDVVGLEFAGARTC